MMCISCFLPSQDALNCLDTARASAANFLSSQVPSIPRDEVFHLAITAYALSLSQEKSLSAYQELWKIVRNDCKSGSTALFTLLFLSDQQ
jgi:hypothetical protein